MLVPRIKREIPIQTDPENYIPVFVGVGTVTNIDMKYARNGKFLELYGKFTVGTVTAVTASMSLPTGLTVDTTLSSISLIGQGVNNFTTNPGAREINVLAISGSTVVNFSFNRTDSTANAISALLGTEAFHNGETISLFAKIPIAEWSVSE